MLMESSKDSLSMELEKAMALFSGIMDKFSKDNGKMEQKMASEYGDPQGEIFIKETGCSIDSMEKEFISIVSALTRDNFPIF